jgi:hypothetical protein
MASGKSFDPAGGGTCAGGAGRGLVPGVHVIGTAGAKGLGRLRRRRGHAGGFTGTASGKHGGNYKHRQSRDRDKKFVSGVLVPAE